MIVKIEDMLVNKFGYFSEDRNTGAILTEQKGVMRTNCLDCLDRTNVVQNKIAFRIVENILDKLKEINNKKTNGHHQSSAMIQKNLDSMGFTDLTTNDAFIFDVMKHMWADNGDVISKQYAGTSSTITSVTKTGKQGIFGKLDQYKKAVERFVVNNI